jgi:hypothetical protein
MRMRSVIAAALIMFCSWTTTASADPVQWPISSGGNGHYYDFVSAPNILWTDANTAAQSLVFHGVNGYLATLTSAAENNFLFSTFSAEAGPLQEGWLGGYQDTSAPDYSEPSEGWRWVTGEPWSYTAWANGEPDNLGGNQNYLRGGSTWDDMSNNPTNESVQFVSGYFVEYPVPEPGSCTMLIGSLVLVARRRTFSSDRL